MGKTIDFICGIYKISNKMTGKGYIGSSKDIAKRWKDHIWRLQKGVHPNNHLQHAWTKDGSESFMFEIIEEVNKDKLLETEQKYIDISDKVNIYNLTMNTYGGGWDCLSKKVILLNLDGSIAKEYNSVADLRRSIGRASISYRTINTDAILMSKYRVVTPDFYDKNLELIKSWKSVSNIQKHKKSERDLNKKVKYEVILNGDTWKFYKMSEIGKFLNVSNQRIGQIVQSEEFKKSGRYINRWTGVIIKLL